MMGPLNIEINFLNQLGNCLKSRGSAESLLKAKITSLGKAESFLSGSHPKRSWFAHHVTCASLSLLKKEAYQ